MRRIARCAKELGLPVEINLLGITSGRDYPCTQFLEAAAAEGCTAILGRDAHTPHAFYETDALEKAIKMAESAGLRITDKADFHKLENYYKKL